MPARRRADAAEEEARAARDELALAQAVLQLCNDVLHAYATHVAGRYGLSVARLDLLLRIARDPATPPRPADLARDLGCSRATMTRLLAALEREGLVVRRADPDDGRSHRVALSNASARVLRELRPLHERRLRALVWHLDPDDRRDLVRLAERLRAGLARMQGP